MNENKVQFNLKNVHYAVKRSSGYATPVAVPGAVSLSLSPEGETNNFYADGIAYYVGIANNGYSGTLEMAKFPAQMLEDVWNMTKDTNNVLTENNSVEVAEFALLFQIDGDQESELFCLYNCKAARPDISAQTTTATKEPQTQSATITCAPDETGKVFARTTASTQASVKTAWFDAVYAA